MDLGLPIVALESTVITHGLPHPQNLSLAHDMEAEVRNQGATPATIAVLDGTIQVGMTDSQLENLATASREPSRHDLSSKGEKDPSIREKQVRKVSRRDFAAAISRKDSGGTTVAGTMFAADKIGIKVFATGGIGGVHAVDTIDISADLMALADTPMIVVCAGAKAILDLPATLEYLETMSVPVVGYQTDKFPAFFSRGSGLGVSLRLDSPEEIVAFSKAHWELGMKSAVLVCQPLPAADALDPTQIKAAIDQAKKNARIKKLHGQEVTPYLLERLVGLTGGASLKANIALLLNNARLAAQISRIYSAASRKML